MSVERRLRRVLLFVPATERRKAEKAARLQPDAVILDLEDAIPAGRKAEARRAAAECLAGIDFGASERLVRVNAIREGGAGDLRSLARAAAPPDGFVLPKVESAAEVRAAARALDAIERPRRGKSRAALLALIESARGVVRVGEIARSHPRLEALLFGAEDLVGDLGGVRTREGREACYARSAVAIHAAAEGRQAIDTPFVDLRDTSGLVAQAREALALGYSGKLAIHPDQIEPILGVFTPDPAEVEAAVRLLEEHGRRAARGEGVFSFEGRMVDRPMIRAAEELLRRAERAGLRASGRRR